MTMLWWHRLRGHKIRHETAHIRLPGTFIERGLIERVTRCSCGERWFTR